MKESNFWALLALSDGFALSTFTATDSGAAIAGTTFAITGAAFSNYLGDDFGGAGSDNFGDYFGGADSDGFGVIPNTYLAAFCKATFLAFLAWASILAWYF